MSFPFRLILALATSSLWWPVRAVTLSISVPACTMPEFPLNPVNLQGQSPCEVAAYLGAVCSPIDPFTIDSIVAGLKYINGAPDNCTCSTVYYGALSACAACQGGGFSTWSEWSSVCFTVYTNYPNPVPAQTEIPHWAFQSYIGVNATFNVADAVALGDFPESVAPSSTSSTSTATGSATSSDNGGKLEVGAIAGGAVGGLAFISLSAVGAVVFCCRRRQENRSSEPILDGVDMQMAAPTPFVLPSSSSTPPLRPYNPSDPSTIPHDQSHMSQNTSSVHYRSLNDSSAGYTGSAEV
ncbi:hypothetical protein BDP27DRAFT_1326580 [Rhodocollybia butyracea]|uniref:Uncharacterized protein n=1 Tax=Rhodocollybia butyracea TaxID=206335 RepID=A0A9P5U6D7_9AGAR|nr:hypothetical protein BDP27DRAFT_1326580 [Rhodocollybia butyracea]